MAKAAVNKKKTLFHQQIGLKFKEGTSRVLHLQCRFIWHGNLDTSKSRSEIPRKF